MGLVTQTITFTAGIKPTASAWTNQFTTLYNLVNGSLDSANVDKTSSDGIMVLDTAQTRTAALTMSTAGLAFSGAISASSWTTNGLVLKTAAATYTDSSTAGSGTAATGVFTSFGVPTLAATNTSVTTTDAATVYIAGAPAAGTNQTLTNAYALWVDAGAVRFDGALTAGTLGAGATTVTSLILADSQAITMGTGSDATLQFDGTNTVLATAAQLVLTPTTDTIFSDGTGVVIGHTAQVTTGQLNEFQVLGTGTADSRMTIANFAANANAPNVEFLKSRNAAIGSSTIVQDNDQLGQIVTYADDGTDYATVPTLIRFEVDDAAPTGSSIGGAMSFWTAAGVGADDIAERMRIDSAGIIGINDATPSTEAARLQIYDNTAASVPVVNIHQDNASATESTLYVTTDSTAVGAIQTKTGSLTNPGTISSGAHASIGDDGTGFITTAGTFRGIIAIQATNNATGAHVASGVFSVSNITSQEFVIILSQDAAIFEASTSDLGGTTGTDVKVTISAHSGGIEIENRMGASVYFHCLVSATQ